MSNRVDEDRVAVIGAGLGGLAAAMRLAAAGFSVEVFEQQSGPGGKAFTEEVDGYRFDTGPSMFTMREVFDDLFTATGARLEDYIDLVPLDVVCTYFWGNGETLRAHSDLHRLVSGIERTFGEPAENLSRYLSYSRRVYETAAPLFLGRSLHELHTYLSRTFWSALTRVGRIDALRTMDEAIGSFVRHPRVRQLLDRYATYNGSSPYRAPATLNLIPSVEYDGGAYGVREGIYAIPRAMERRAKELGVAFHYGTPVESVLTERRRGGRHLRRRGYLRRGRFVVTGIRAGGEERRCDFVLSNVDVRPTYERLLEDTGAPLYRRYQRLEPSSSGLVFYWGMNRSFPALGLHNIFFSDDYRLEFRQIFDELRCPDDPTVYVNITARIAPEDAPEGHENWFVLVNAPYDVGQDWEAETLRVRRRVLERVGGILSVDLEKHIAAEATMSPEDIAARTGSTYGSLYGISSNSRSAAFLRHRNRSTRHRGLYFCGGSAHPGGGMPLAVLSGKIASELIMRAARGRTTPTR